MAPLLPSTRLVACPACREHVKSDAAVCPHCGVGFPERNRFGFASAAIVGLALSGCPDKDMMTTAEPEYGVATTEPMTSTGSDTDAGTGTTTAGTGTTTTAGTGSDSVSVSGEPDYGVPTTDFTGGEPEYGVPETSTSGTTTSGTTTAGTTTSGTTTAGTGGEPEYGVPETTAQPDYGVPDTTN
jgi:hypothetical protein